MNLIIVCGKVARISESSMKHKSACYVAGGSLIRASAQFLGSESCKDYAYSSCEKLVIARTENLSFVVLRSKPSESSSDPIALEDLCAYFDV